MLRISKLADYGTVVMVYLAKHAQELCNARDIALHTHLAVPTVSKILKRLTGAGLLTSVRGVAGGYRLQRSLLKYQFLKLFMPWKIIVVLLSAVCNPMIVLCKEYVLFRVIGD